VIELLILGFLKINDGVSANEICQTLARDKTAVTLVGFLSRLHIGAELASSQPEAFPIVERHGR
jgi:hypothetical protein